MSKNEISYSNFCDAIDGAEVCLSYGDCFKCKLRSERCSRTLSEWLLRMYDLCAAVYDRKWTDASETVPNDLEPVWLYYPDGQIALGYFNAEAAEWRSRINESDAPVCWMPVETMKPFPPENGEPEKGDSA